MLRTTTLLWNMAYKTFSSHIRLNSSWKVRRSLLIHRYWSHLPAKWFRICDFFFWNFILRWFFLWYFFICWFFILLLVYSLLPIVIRWLINRPIYFAFIWWSTFAFLENVLIFSKFTTCFISQSDDMILEVMKTYHMSWFLCSKQVTILKQANW